MGPPGGDDRRLQERRDAQELRNHLSDIAVAAPQILAHASLTIDTPGAGIVEFTRDAADFLTGADAGDGVLLAFLRHTSASLTIQENADPDVQRDLMTALQRLAPEDAGWVHDAE